MKRIISISYDMEGNYLFEIPDTIDYKLLTSYGNSKLLVYKAERKNFNTKRIMEVYGIGNN